MTDTPNEKFEAPDGSVPEDDKKRQAASAASDKTKKRSDQAGRAIKKTGEAADKGAQAASKGVKAGSKAAGAAMTAAGEGTAAATAGTGPGAVIGVPVGKAIAAAGKAVEAGGVAASKGVEASGKAAKAGSKVVVAGTKASERTSAAVEGAAGGESEVPYSGEGGSEGLNVRSSGLSSQAGAGSSEAGSSEAGSSGSSGRGPAGSGGFSAPSDDLVKDASAVGGKAKEGVKKIGSKAKTAALAAASGGSAVAAAKAKSSVAKKAVGGKKGSGGSEEGNDDSFSDGQKDSEEGGSEPGVPGAGGKGGGAGKAGVAKAAKGAALASGFLFPLLAGFVVLVILSVLAAFLFSGSVDDQDLVGVYDAQMVDAALDSPAMFDAYWETAEKHGVPLSILMAVGQFQTAHGRYSPYDTVFRDEGDASNFITIDPPIEGEEGNGPFLLPSDVINPVAAQNYKQSLDVLGDLLNQAITAELVDREIPVELFETNYKVALFGGASFAEEFWVDVLDRVPLGDPSSECTRGSSSVIESIDILWSCEAEGKNYSIYSDGQVLSGAFALNKLKEEAYIVAHYFSANGTAVCDPDAELAGVFPLPVSEEYDRCDPVENIKATAAIVLPPNEGDFPDNFDASRVAAGWKDMPFVLGDRSFLSSELPSELATAEGNAACRKEVTESFISFPDEFSAFSRLSVSVEGSEESTGDVESGNVEFDDLVASRDWDSIYEASDTAKLRSGLCSFADDVLWESIVRASATNHLALVHTHAEPSVSEPIETAVVNAESSEVYIVGDSFSVGVSEAASSAAVFPELNSSGAVPDASIASISSFVRDAADAGVERLAVVVGINDVSEGVGVDVLRERVSVAMDAAPSACQVWATYKETGYVGLFGLSETVDLNVEIPVYNSILKEEAAGRDNVFIADVAPQIDANSRFVDSDSVRLTSEGYSFMARSMSDSLGECVGIGDHASGSDEHEASVEGLLVWLSSDVAQAPVPGVTSLLPRLSSPVVDVSAVPVARPSSAIKPTGKESIVRLAVLFQTGELPPEPKLSLLVGDPNGTKAYTADLIAAGYTNGKLPPELVVNVGDNPWGVACDIEASASIAWNAMVTAAASDGITITGWWCYRTYERQVSARLNNCGGTLSGPCSPAAAVPGTSNHGWGRAVDLGDSSGILQSFCSPEFVWLENNARRFGWVHPPWARSGTQCQIRRSSDEPWHWEFTGGVRVGAGVPAAFDLRECAFWTSPGTMLDPYDTQLLAQASYAMFYCAAIEAGLGSSPPETGGNPTLDVSSFSSLAEQIAAEAVMVAGCESGYIPDEVLGENPWGYGGVFQFGDREIARWGYIPGNPFAAKTNPHNNIYASTKYMLSQVGRNKWDGWGPWAPVNTDYGGPNVHVKVPNVPRFPSTRSGYAGQYVTSGYPAFALDPWTYKLPNEGGFPCIVVPNKAWGPAVPLNG